MPNYSVHELALLIPSMTSDEYAELKEDIKTNGLLTPITLYENQILDGRHRYQVCGELGIEGLFDVYEGDTPARFVLSKNIFRRNLTASQKAAVATDMLPWYEKEARERMEQGRPKEGKEILPYLPESTGQAREKLGETIGVSGRYIQEAKRLKKENPGAFERVKKGEVSLRGAIDVERISVRTNNIWNTPKKYIDAARNVLGIIDCDPASNEEANRAIQATIFYTEEVNGLEQEWEGNVWLNPPYGGIAADFAEKLVEQYEKGITKQAILLVNANSTDTKWFAPLWNYSLCFTNHRINFASPDNVGNNQSTHGSVFIYLGKQKQKFIDSFKQFGPIVERIDVN